MGKGLCEGDHWYYINNVNVEFIFEKKAKPF